MTYSITPMNCITLLGHLQAGAKLRTYWTYGRRLNSLTLPSGEVLYVQRSNVKALIKSGALGSIPFSGDNYEYYLPPSKG